MNLEILRARIWYLAGQLEEAKHIYQAALKEIKSTDKEQPSKQEHEDLETILKK